MLSIMYLLLLVRFALAVAMIWLGFAVVKHRRREHLLWIVPFAASSALGTFVSGGTIAFANLVRTFNVYSILSSVQIVSTHIEAFAVFALVYVIWKKIDATEAGETPPS